MQFMEFVNGNNPNEDNKSFLFLIKSLRKTIRLNIKIESKLITFYFYITTKDTAIR